jgi:osmoprotectant transport system ATP-binding protein
LITAGEAAEPGADAELTVPADASLRDALAELVWRGAATSTVTDAAGNRVGNLTLEGILARGRAL